MLTHEERTRRLKSMLEKCARPFGGFEALRSRASELQRGALVQPMMVEGVVIEQVVNDERERQVSVAALDELVKPRSLRLGETELLALEAIVMPNERPVALIRDGQWDALSDPWTKLNDIIIRNRFRSVIPSVGRIEVPNSPYPYAGTGFVVGPDLLMTNRHVARLFVDGVGMTSLTYRQGDAAVDMNREVASSPIDRTAYFDVVRVKMVHPYWDMALLEVKGLEAFPPLWLSVEPPKSLDNREILTVGYPALDERNDLKVQDRVFNSTYSVKRAQPGTLMGLKLVDSFRHQVPALLHNSSTLGGNSGSAIVDIETAHVVGLHFGGEYLVENYAVPTAELARDARIVDCGVNFERTIPTENDWEDYWRIVGESMQSAGHGRQIQSRQEWKTAMRSGASNGNVSLTIPLTITVSLEVFEKDRTAIPGSVSDEAPRMQTPIVYDGLERRNGYDEAFLGASGTEKSSVALPPLTPLGKQVAAPVDGSGHVLKYHKFSIVMHRHRRLAIYTASNVDWDPDNRKPKGKKPTRKELTGLGETQQEQWVTDWRIAQSSQLPDIFYTKDGGAFDKGHLVRRDDVCWGATFEDIQKANGDTYHTTNCSPQVMGFNRASEGEDNWGDLETLVQKETGSQRACIFAGPVLGDRDRFFDGRTESGTVRVRIPDRFWKIICVKEENLIECYGFVLEQALNHLDLSTEEFAVPSRWRKSMASIEEIEKLLNGWVDLSALKFGDQIGNEKGMRVRRAMK